MARRRRRCRRGGGGGVSGDRGSVRGDAAGRLEEARPRCEGRVRHRRARGLREGQARRRLDGTTVSFKDPSGTVWITVDRDIKADDKDHEIPQSAAARAFAEWATLQDGEYSWGIADDPAPKGDPQPSTYKDRKAAENTIVYTATDDPQLREAQVRYYRAGNGDMYRLWIDYPGRGYFTQEGREIAREAIANWDVHQL